MALFRSLELCPRRQCDAHQNGPVDLRAEWLFMSRDLHTGGIDVERAMIHDPIVEEVRAIREQLAAQFNFDIRKIVADAQRRQAASKARIVSFQRISTPTQQGAIADQPETGGHS